MMAKDPAKRYQRPIEGAPAFAPFVKEAKAAPGRTAPEQSAEKAKPAPIPVDDGNRRSPTPPMVVGAGVTPTQVGPAAAWWQTAAGTGQPPASPAKRQSRRGPWSAGTGSATM